ncbi:hypothetical protein [Pyramidobacter piscolens]|uniref:hypothetical protein n=1 Tax=Pyramidobacter piscolens TaxID=638849 RepID=UPI001FCB506A|nr:hypothetical protein [Pyramidobacter piscolens]
MADNPLRFCSLGSGAKARSPSPFPFLLYHILGEMFVGGTTEDAFSRGKNAAAIVS